MKAVTLNELTKKGVCPCRKALEEENSKQSLKKIDELINGLRSKSKQSITLRRGYNNSQVTTNESSNHEIHIRYGNLDEGRDALVSNDDQAH